MSVHTRPHSPTYWCDFRIQGQRFRCSTGQTERRAAEVVEKRLKQEARASINKATAERAAWNGQAPPSMGNIVARYWREVGQFHSAPRTTWWALEWLVEHFGEEKLIVGITSADIASMVAHRRMIRVRRDAATRRLVEIPCAQVANATVNRYAIEPLRKLFRRARDVWGYSVAYPNWGELRLPEPEERVREAAPGEDKAIIEALGPDYGRLFRFMLATGVRASGALLQWSQVDRVNRLARIRNKNRKGQNSWYTIPLTANQLSILDECVGHHPSMIFTYAVQRDGRTHARGERKPITDSGFKTHWRRRVRNAGVAPGFRRHDARHTAATRLIRATGNLKAAQRLLGHSRVDTTTRYAHVLLEDIRLGQETVESALAATASKERPDAQ
jgi:integrase